MKRFGAMMLSLLLLLSGAGSATAEETRVSSETLYVQKVDGLSDDFILGADVSTLLVQEASGVVYRDFDGQPQDMLRTLADSGLNYVRVRVWVDPFDQSGNGYGGGNCTAETAGEIGRRAAQYGMKLLVDFHYSDFWADPSKQMVPKAWAGLSVEEKAQKIDEYTSESLRAIRAAGADIGMVQIGNEINNGLSGEFGDDQVSSLLKAASEAVRAFDPGVRIVVHYTEPGPWFADKAEQLIRDGVDYDVFATSYYPFWHGTLDNLKEQLSAVTERCGKTVMVAETQWPFTTEDGDGSGNTVSAGSGYEDIYPFTVQGQSREIRDVAAAVASIDGGIGVFYWEAGWIPVPGESYGVRSALWEQYGSGWASSYAAEYDPNDAGQYYGGSGCDNQALFDFAGNPLESLKTFALLKTGNDAPVIADALDSAVITVRVGESVTLPETVSAVFTDGSRAEAQVTWDQAEAGAVTTDAAGQFLVHGIGDGKSALCYVNVVDANYLKNYSFEDEDLSMWVITPIAGGDQADFQVKALDAYSGEVALHFWDSAPVNFRCEQTVEDLPAGSWRVSVQAQGDEVGKDAEIYLYVVADGQTYTAPIDLKGWVNWQEAVLEHIPCASGTITVGVYVRCQSGGWGTFDDFLLCLED